MHLAESVQLNYLDNSGEVVVVTSGAGPTMGGIGVVTSTIAGILGKSSTVKFWIHHHRSPRVSRWLALLSDSFRVLATRPSLIIYEHIDLARLHVMVPWLRRIPFVVMLYGVEAWKPVGGVRRHAVRNASRVLAISNWTVREARKVNPWLPEVTVTWLGVSPRPPVALGRSTTFLMLGRIASAERYKGHDQVLDAWPTIKRAVPDAALVIAGDGDDRPRLEGRVARERLVGVRFTGFISDVSRDELLDTAGVLLFPSAGEGFGLVVVEAAHAGLPVIALRHSVVAELFPDHGVTFVESQSPDDIACAAIALMSAPAERRRLADRARVRALAFTLEAFGERFRNAVAPWVPSL